MSRLPKLDKFHDVMFRELDESALTEDEKKMLVRYRALFTLSLEKPSIPDVELRDYLMNEFAINMTQAYRDLSNVRILLGSVQNAGKEWVRYTVNETLKKAIEDARLMGKAGIKLMIMAADKLGKYNRLDREDSQELPWDEIIPQQIEPVNDPTVLGIKPMTNREEEIRRLYQKYKDEIEIEDIEFEPAEKGE